MKKKEKKARKWPFIVISFAILMIVIGFVILFREKLDKVTLTDESFYQYFSGQRYDYEGTLHLKKDGSITNLSFDGKDYSVTLDSTPIYYKDKKKVLFAENMMVVYPKSNISQYKVNYFTTIEQNENRITLKDGTMTKDLTETFLYDGKDLYFFPEEITLKVGNETYTLSPFSYVNCEYGNKVSIYQYDEDTMTEISITTETVEASKDGYTINLSMDSVSLDGMNNSRLLFKKIELLNNLEGE